MGERYNIHSQLEHLQSKYIGTGHADTTKWEWLTNQHRDRYRPKMFSVWRTLTYRTLWKLSSVWLINFQCHRQAAATANCVASLCQMVAHFSCAVQTFKGVWLKSPSTPPTIISNPYQLNKQVKQSGEFINIKW